METLAEKTTMLKRIASLVKGVYTKIKELLPKGIQSDPFYIVIQSFGKQKGCHKIVLPMKMVKKITTK